MRPPGRGSNVTARPWAPETEWPAGHHSDVRSAQTAKAWSGRRRRRRPARAAPSPLSGVRRGDAKARGGVAPHLLEVGAHRLDARVVEAVEPAGALGAIRDQAGLLEQPQVARDRRPADRQRVGELAHGAVARPQRLDDGAAVWIAERVERVALAR